MKTWFKNRVMVAVLGLFVCFGVGFAEPAPLGFTLGKATLDEVKAKYGGSAVKEKLFSPGLYPRQITTNEIRGILWAISADKIDMQDLKSLTMYFNENNILEYIQFSFEEHRFDELFLSLQSKYKPLKSHNYNASAAVFKDGKSEIILYERYKILEYMHSSFLQRLEDSANEAKQKRQDKQKSLL